MDTGDGDRLSSNFRLEITLAVGYQRKRASVEGKWEGRFVTLCLLVAGIPFCFLVVWGLFQHFA